MDLDKISPKLIGKKVILGPTREDLNDTYRRWLHDLKVGVYLNASQLYSHDEEDEWFVSNHKAGNIHFTVYDKGSGTPIGSTGLMSIEQVHRTAEFGIMIGEKEYQNRGYGTEATALTIDYGFNALNLASIFLRVYDFNTRGIRVYERIGFKKIGIRRRAYFVGGKFYDDVFMDIIPEEFKGGVIRDLMKEIEGQSNA
jgi:RimJ/RimL family protein N-acetyltransferase